MNDMLEGIIVVVVITAFVVAAFFVSSSISSKFTEVALIANSTNNTHGLDIVELPYGNGTVACVHESGWFTSQLDCDWRPAK